MKILNPIILIILAITVMAAMSLAESINVTPTGVGIGTASPTATLTITNNDDAKLKLYTNGGSIGVIDSVSNTSDSTGRWLSINPTGANVGIGIMTPQSLLHLNKASANIEWMLQLSNPNNLSSSNYGSGIKFQNSTPSSGIQEANKWAGVAGVAGTGYSNETDLTIYTNGFDSALNQTSAPSERIRVKATTGNVGIGTINPSHKLTVNGDIRANRFVSNTQTYADFVLKPDYQLPTLSEVEAHIKNNGHLQGIPSESEAMKNGMDLADMQVRLLAKIEELTLHMIAHEKAIEVLREENSQLKTELKLVIGAQH